MATIRYYCTHCAHSFEAEEKENMECPSCVWTSSVVRESEHREREVQQQSESSKRKMPVLPQGFMIAMDAIKPLLILLLVLGLIAAGFLFFKPQVVGLGQKIQSGGVKLKQTAIDIQGSPDEKKKQAKKPKMPAGQDLVAETQQPVLSEQEKAVLARKIELDPARELSPMEKDLLGRVASLKTGRVEKLPGPFGVLSNSSRCWLSSRLLIKCPCRGVIAISCRCYLKVNI